MIWLIAILLALTLALFLAQPLWRRETENAPRRSYDLAVYRDQLAELEREQASGLSPAPEAQAARAEIARRMLAADKGDRAPHPPAVARPWIALALVVAAPLGAVLLYAAVGRPDLPDRPAAERSSPVAELPPEQQAQMIRNMVESLAARLAQNPDDLAGWRRLARSYRVLGEIEPARAAADKAVKLAPDDIDVLGEFVELHAPMSPEAEMSPIFLATLRRMLELKSDHVQALFFLGLHGFRSGDRAAARGYWERLLKLLPADTQAALELRRRLEQLTPPSGG
jgi:cytochrome c-type biogenesis protein CcmH